MTKHQYTCPKCGSHYFQLVITQLIDVDFEADGEHEVVEGPFGDMEWTDKTEAICLEHCGWAGPLAKAATT